MVRKTIREDWLSNTLANARYFVSASPVTSKDYVDSGLVALRFAAHHPAGMQRPKELAPNDRRTWLPSHYDLMMSFLTVELDSESQIAQFQPKKRLLTLAAYINSLFHVPISIYVFSGETPGKLNERIWVRDAELSVNGLIAPEEYARLINERRRPLDWDEPQIKGLNRSLNDHFQIWTRTYLSGQLSINDVDALKTIERAGSDNIILICELKRPNESVETWLPYLNDVPNFMLAKSIARTGSNAIDLTIQYNNTQDKKVSVHMMTHVTKERITGFRKVITGESREEVVANIQNYITAMCDGVYTSRRELRRM